MAEQNEKTQNYTDINSAAIDRWCQNGWEWGTPLSHEAFIKAQHGEWNVLLTPTRFVPHAWLGDLHGKKLLGLASGGGQQMPVFAALGAECTVLDYSAKQLESEQMVAAREGYAITAVQADMTQPLPFADDSFDIIFHPVSNSYIREVQPVWNECMRVLKHGGRLLAGLDNGLSFAFNDEGTALVYCLPFDPLADEQLYKDCMENDWGLQFSHTIDEQIGGQLRAGFVLKDIFGDTDGYGNLHTHNLETFYATLAVKP